MTKEQTEVTKSKTPIIKYRKFSCENVKSVFDSYPPSIKKKMMELRELVFDTAATIDEVGELEETLKWGEPSYVTAKTKSGSTLRMDWKPKHPDQFAMYFHCQTKLVSTFRQLYPNKFHFEGNRAIVFGIEDEIPRDELSHCIALTLNYHNMKNSYPLV